MLNELQNACGPGQTAFIEVMPEGYIVLDGAFTPAQIIAMGRALERLEPAPRVEEDLLERNLAPEWVWGWAGTLIALVCLILVTGIALQNL